MRFKFTTKSARILILQFCLLIPVIISAQEVKWNLRSSEKIEVKKRTDKLISFLLQTDKGFYFYGESDNEPVIFLWSNDLKTCNSYQIQSFNKGFHKSIPVTVFSNKKNIYALYYSGTGEFREKQYSIREYHFGENKFHESTKDVFQTRHINPDPDKDIRLIQSEDKSVVAVYTEDNDNRENGVTNFNIAIYKGELEPIWIRKDFPFPVKSDKMKIVDDLIDKEGNLFLIVQQSSKSMNNEKEKMLSDNSFHLYSITKKGTQTNHYEIKVDSLIISSHLRLRFISDSTIAIFGLSAKYRSSLLTSTGYFNILVSRSELKETRSASSKFPLNLFLSSTKMKGEINTFKHHDKYYKSPFFTDLYIKEYFPYSDGSAVIFFERTITGTTTYNSSYMPNYNTATGQFSGPNSFHSSGGANIPPYQKSIIAIRINSIGEMEWFVTIPKHQVGGSGLESFLMVRIGKNYFVFYNDHPKHVPGDINTLDIALNGAKAARTIGVGINEEGKVFYSILLNLDMKSDMMLRLKNTFLLKENYYLIQGLSKDQLKVNLNIIEIKGF